MTVRVKICGITNLEDALAAVEAGADALGFVFAPSPRRISPEAAAAILRELPPFVLTVGLVVDEDPRPLLERCPVDRVQFHGAEPPEVVLPFGPRAIKAFRVRATAEADALLAALPRYAGAGAFLLDAWAPDAAGGTGRRFPWEVALPVRRCGTPLIVAGGLTPENVGDCIRLLRPYGVDVSSGVERAPGRKDPARMRAFVAAARAAAAALPEAAEEEPPRVPDPSAPARSDATFRGDSTGPHAPPTS